MREENRFLRSSRVDAEVGFSSVGGVSTQHEEILRSRRREQLISHDLRRDFCPREDGKSRKTQNTDD